MFKQGDLVCAKNGYLNPGETRFKSAGIVVDYNPMNDYLKVGVVDTWNYAFPPIQNVRGCFYRLATAKEKQKWSRLWEQDKCKHMMGR